MAYDYSVCNNKYKHFPRKFKNQQPVDSSSQKHIPYTLKKRSHDHQISRFIYSWHHSQFLMKYFFFVFVSRFCFLYFLNHQPLVKKMKGWINLWYLLLLLFISNCCCCYGLVDAWWTLVVHSCYALNVWLWNTIFIVYYFVCLLF